MATVPKEELTRIPRPVSAANEPAPVERGALSPAVQGAPMFTPGTVVDGRYRVIRFLNQGGNGVVYEVEHLRTGRRLAMKSLVDDANAARLEQEARATALMKNAHVVKITDMGPVVDASLVGPAAVRAAAAARNVPPYLVMELLEGQNLRELLEEAGQLPLDLTVNIALQVCECLTEAHDRNVIHRDLKPDNLFLLKSAWPGQYEVIVLDFGVMKIAGEGPIPKGSLTRTGSTVGTPYYMSLEQLRNSSAVDVRADIYSLGVVLYECLAGRKPFTADTIGDLVYALCSGPPTPLQRLRPDLPQDVCDAVMRALKMNRDDRQPSMSELGASLMSHGHPAFSLWLRAGEGGAGVMGSFASLREPLPSRPMVPVVPAPPSADEGEGETVTAVAPSRQIEEAEAAAAAREAVPTGPVPMVRVPPVAASTGAPARDRDTPTEMFRGAFTREAHAALPRDRDTPTRALRAPSFADIEMPTGNVAIGVREDSQGVFVPARADTFRLDGRFGSATERMLGDEARAVQGVGDGPPGRYAETLRSAESQSAQGQQAGLIATGMNPQLGVTGSGGAAEPPRFGAPPDPRGTGTYSAAVLPSFKPAWQVSLDKALAAVGGALENGVRKVKASPRPIQYAILGAFGLVVVLVGVLFLVLVFR